MNVLNTKVKHGSLILHSALCKHPHCQVVRQMQRIYILPLKLTYGNYMNLVTTITAKNENLHHFLVKSEISVDFL